MARSASVFTLRNNGAVSYSPAERKIFALLREEPKDSSLICRLRYGKKKIPFNGRKIVIGALSSLARKVRINKEFFKIASTKRAGPRAMAFWIVPSSHFVPKADRRPAGSVGPRGRLTPGGPRKKPAMDHLARTAEP